MKIVCLVLAVIAIEATVKPKRWQFNRVLRVDPVNHSLYTLSSNTGIRNHAVCAKNCKSEECLSFSFSAVDQTCDTYSRLIVEEEDVDISTPRMYFSKMVGDSSDVKSSSGVCEIITEGKRINLFCDRDTADGPWYVIQRRTSKDVDFYRNWTEYKNGFGDLLGNFWIGNDNLHLLTTTPRILRVELEAWDGTRGYAQYSTFQVAGEDQNYKLLVQGFSGNVSFDAMGVHNGHAFTTYDRDNDNNNMNCAKLWLSGWWYVSCYTSHLNGRYAIYDGNQAIGAMTWRGFPELYHIPLKKTKMIIR
ncbi:ficolin-3-like [Pecten maximus]|uniref:ficolin-3-like n=1 Tax=Pecten maximus TaxID=6579 RepID=UPI0014580B54|nr:ficolin-3-like [Pecten maximus]